MFQGLGLGTSGFDKRGYKSFHYQENSRNGFGFKASGLGKVNPRPRHGLSGGADSLSTLQARRTGIGIPENPIPLN